MARTAGPATGRFLALFIPGVAVYVIGVALSSFFPGWGLPAWPPTLLVLPGVGLMAAANIVMYRSADEFQKRKIGEAVLFAFVVSTAMILAVGVLQTTILPQANWIFAFSFLMLMWALGTILAAIRYR